MEGKGIFSLKIAGICIMIKKRQHFIIFIMPGRADISHGNHRKQEITLSGERCSAEQIASACAVREHGCYMGDYIWDERGDLSEIRYDRIGQERGRENGKGRS